MAGFPLEVLLVPRKADTMSLVRRAAEMMDLNLHVSTDPDEIETWLFCHRYDGVILEHDEESTGRLMRALRQSPSSKGAIAIDIHDETVNLQSVFAMGANFEIVYPLTLDRVRRTMALAHGLMLLGRRRYYRHPVEIPARVLLEAGEFDAVISNVSEQGIGLRCEATTLPSGAMQCTFVLPDNSSRVSIDVTVVWSDKAGQAGCRIEQVVLGREQFQSWVSRLFHQGVSATTADNHDAPRRAEEASLNA